MSNGTTDPNYRKLEQALLSALERASRGKGKERHATEEPFEKQGLCRRLRRYGVNGALYQIDKKVDECATFDRPAKIRELQDIIVYAAAAIIILEELEER